MRFKFSILLPHRIQSEKRYAVAESNLMSMIKCKKYVLRNLSQEDRESIVVASRHTWVAVVAGVAVEFFFSCFVQCSFTLIFLFCTHTTTTTGPDTRPFSLSRFCIFLLCSANLRSTTLSRPISGKKISKVKRGRSMQPKLRFWRLNHVISCNYFLIVFFSVQLDVFSFFPHTHTHTHTDLCDRLVTALPVCLAHSVNRNTAAATAITRWDFLQASTYYCCILQTLVGVDVILRRLVSISVCFL